MATKQNNGGRKRTPASLRPMKMTKSRKAAAVRAHSRKAVKR